MQHIRTETIASVRIREREMSLWITPENNQTQTKRHKPPQLLRRRNAYWCQKLHRAPEDFPLLGLSGANQEKQTQKEWKEWREERRDLRNKTYFRQKEPACPHTFSNNQNYFIDPQGEIAFI